MKTKLLTIATMVALMLETMTKVQAQAPCLPQMHGLIEHQSASCGITQMLALTTGWNWISLSIDTGNPIEMLQMLETALGDNAVQIQSFDDNTEFDGEEWFGGLDDTGISNAQMYMIEVVNDCTVELQGPAANPTNYQITIEPGQWNWIGFPSTVELGIANALSEFNPEEADQIQAGNIMTEFDGEEWFGYFVTLVP